MIIDFKMELNSIILSTNLNYEFILDKANSTKLIKYSGSYIPIATVRNNIEGFFNRNIYYKLIDFALEKNYINNNILYIPSNDMNHPIGQIA